MNNTRAIPNRFYSLDSIRGLASLCVVFWHWQNFFYSGTHNYGYNITQQPLYSIFYPLYNKGWLAVDFFFCLSGFIFFWLYSQNIAQKNIGLYEFFVLRFSRLYPLHFATLIVVMIGQIISKSTTGDFTIYPFNDLYHFILNLFFISSWGFESGVSYNGPISSVSVEIILYMIFFVFAYFNGARSLTITVLIVIVNIYMPLSIIRTDLLRGIISFFIGGSTFLAYDIIRKRNSAILCTATGLTATFFWIITFTHFGNTVLLKLTAYFDTGFLKIFIEKTIQYIPFVEYIFAVSVIFPSTILSLALLETFKGTLGARIKYLGDISYSSYLLHFPLQLMIILIFKTLSIEKKIFYTKMSLFLFFSILLIISYFCFHYFERPAQKYLRNKLLKTNRSRL